MAKVCGIYSITSPSGKCYIGSSMSVHARFSGHRTVLRKGSHHCEALQRAAGKYGVGALRFELLCEADPATVRELEQLAIDVVNPSYNSTRCVREPLTDLWRNPSFRASGQKRAGAQMRRLQRDPAFQVSQRAGASKALAGLHTDPEFAAAHKERATERIQRLVNSNPAMQEKAAQARRDRIERDKSDPEVWARRNTAVRALKERPVLCVETGVTYRSQTLAGEWVKSLGYATHRHISTCASGRVERAYGYTWVYVEDTLHAS